MSTFQFTPELDQQASLTNYQPHPITHFNSSINSWRNATDQEVIDSLHATYAGRGEVRHSTFSLEDLKFYNFLKKLDSAITAYNQQSATHPVIFVHFIRNSTFWPVLEIFVDGISSDSWELSRKMGSNKPFQHTFQNMGDYITPDKALQYSNGWNAALKSDLPSLFYAGAPWNQRVDYYQYTESDTMDFYTKAMESVYGEVEAYILLGSEAPSPEDYNRHPVSFRPVLGLWRQQTNPQTTHWDYSNPCPPNCR